MNNMKSTFLFLLTTTMMTCTAYGQSSNHKENKLPDWAFGGFERPKNVNPDRKSTRLNSSHSGESRMPSSA